MSTDGAVTGDQDRDRWNKRYADVSVDGPSAPPVALERLLAAVSDSVRAALPPGPVVDLAGGTGEGARRLAADLERPAVLTDVSDAALAVAEVRAAGDGEPLVTARLDLAGATLAQVNRELATGAPAGHDLTAVAAWSCLHYLNRPLLASVADGLAPGGLFLAAIATVTNQERHARPSARFLLERGELRALVGGDRTELEVLVDVEEWTPERTHEAAIVVRRAG